MSKCKKFSNFTEQELNILRKKGKVVPRADDWNPYPEPIHLWEVDDNGMCWYPFAIDEIQNCEIKTFEKVNSFEVNIPLLTSENDPSGLKRDQNVVFKEIINKLKLNGRVFINCSTGYGKSTIGVHLASKIKRGKCMIAVFASDLQRQWFTTFKKITNVNVQLLVGNKEMDPDAQVYIIGLKKASLQSREFFKDISMFIIDEVDQLPTKMLLKVMKIVNPNYLIGLSATIDRDDNMHQALYAYFGERNTFIKRFLTKDFKVIKYQTNFEPEIEYDANGKLIDNTMTNSLAYNPKRQEMIANIVSKYPNDKMLLLCKRVDEIRGIYKLILKFAPNDVDCKHQYKTDWDVSKRILVGSYKNCGRGVDIKGLTLLILCDGVNHVEQNEGRLRENNTLIIDIVDNHPVYEHRWSKRKAWHTKRGATLYYQIDGSDEIKELPVNQRGRRKNNFNNEIRLLPSIVPE